MPWSEYGLAISPNWSNSFDIVTQLFTHVAGLCSTTLASTRTSLVHSNIISAVFSFITNDHCTVDDSTRDLSLLYES
jgi:putative flippase GtrA